MKVQEHPLRDGARLFIYYVLPYLVKLLPPGFDFAVFRGMGRIYATITKKKKHVKINLMKIFPGQNMHAINTIVQEYFENHFVDRMQVFSFNRFNKQNIHHYIRIGNIEELEKCLSKGRGCVLIHGHFGPAQLFIAAISLAGFPITQIGYISKEGYSLIGEKIAVRKRLELESKIPGKIFYADRFFRPIFESLKRNEIVSNAGDGTGGGISIGEHIPVTFLGTRRSFPVGSVSLAQRTGAELLPLFITKEPDGKYVGEIDRPIQVGTGKAGIQKSVQEFACRLETKIKRQPGLWHFWDEFPEAYY